MSTVTTTAMTMTADVTATAADGIGTAIVAAAR